MYLIFKTSGIGSLCFKLWCDNTRAAKYETTVCANTLMQHQIGTEWVKFLLHLSAEPPVKILQMSSIYWQEEHFKPCLSRLCYGSFLGIEDECLCKVACYSEKGQSLPCFDHMRELHYKRVPSIINWKMESKYSPYRPERYVNICKEPLSTSLDMLRPRQQLLWGTG